MLTQERRSNHTKIIGDINAAGKDDILWFLFDALSK
jgi:hypothetical protein